jgi:general secretion pathway protein G
MKTNRRAWRRTTQSGFTLVELMVVIAIVGLLATVAALKFTDILGGTLPKKVQADFVVFSDAIELYHLKTKGKYPQRLQDLVDAQVIRKLPKDPWGNDYVYAPPSGTKTYIIASYGADGVPGGTDENEDLTTETIDAVLQRK